MIDHHQSIASLLHLLRSQLMTTAAQLSAKKNLSLYSTDLEKNDLKDLTDPTKIAELLEQFLKHIRAYELAYDIKIANQTSFHFLRQIVTDKDILDDIALLKTRLKKLNDSLKQYVTSPDLTKDLDHTDAIDLDKENKPKEIFLAAVVRLMNTVNSVKDQIGNTNANKPAVQKFMSNPNPATISSLFKSAPVPVIAAPQPRSTTYHAAIESYNTSNGSFSAPTPTVRVHS